MISDIGHEGDCIALRGVSGTGYHGVFDHEKREGQVFSVDVDLYVNLAPAAATDDVAMTVDYGEVAQRIHDLITGPALDLIETLAAQIAAACLAFSQVRKVVVNVHKPQAPITVPFGDVSVQVVRQRSSTAVVALGANLGDRHAALQGAVSALAAHSSVTVTATSAVYSTAPVGGPEQGDFLNAVVLIHTSLTPMDLLAVCQQIENDWQRRREVRWGPRTLDIDIITYDDLVQDDELLTLPHPRAHERAFVCVPWADVDPTVDLSSLDQSQVQRTHMELMI